MYCGNCGSQIPDDARFCQNCGFDVHSYSKPIQEAQVKPNAPVVEKTEKGTPVAAVISMLTLSLFSLIIPFLFSLSSNPLSGIIPAACLLVFSIYMTVVLAKNKRGLPLTIGLCALLLLGVALAIVCFSYSNRMLQYIIPFVALSLFLVLPPLLMILMQYIRPFRKIWLLPGILSFLFLMVACLWFSIFVLLLFPIVVFYFACADWLALPNKAQKNAKGQQSTNGIVAPYRLSPIYKAIIVVFFLALGAFPFIPVSNGKIYCEAHSSDYTWCPLEGEQFGNMINVISDMSKYKDHYILHSDLSRAEYKDKLDSCRTVATVGMLMCITIPVIIAFSIIAYSAKTYQSARRDLNILRLAVCGTLGVCVGLPMFLIARNRCDSYIQKYGELIRVNDSYELIGWVVFFVGLLLLMCYTLAFVHAKKHIAEAGQ